MELIIEFDNIEDSSKKKFLLDTLAFLKIKFKAMERPQTLVEYSYLLEKTDFENDDSGNNADAIDANS